MQAGASCSSLCFLTDFVKKTSELELIGQIGCSYFAMIGQCKNLQSLKNHTEMRKMPLEWYLQNVTQYVGLGNHDYDKLAAGAFLMIDHLVLVLTVYSTIPFDYKSYP